MGIDTPLSNNHFLSGFENWLTDCHLGFVSASIDGYPVYYVEGKPGIVVCCITLANWNGVHPLPEFREETRPVIFLWEDIWFRKTEWVKSKLLAQLGKSFRIPARITRVEKIDKPVADAFLEKNHLNGARAARYRFGLFVPKKHFRFLPDYLVASEAESVLVAVAVFAAPKNFKIGDEIHRSGELIGVTGLMGTTVIGGLSKLISHFAKAYPVDDIMTYVDREWSTGKAFLKIGFEFVSPSEPIKFVVDRRNFSRYPLLRIDNKILYEGAENLVHITNAGNLKLVKKFTRTVSVGLPLDVPGKVTFPKEPPYDIIFVIGPTASGKTSLAVRMAYELGGEIISLDSRQVFRGMDIGSGKDLSEYQVGDTRIPYHLIDILDTGTPYSVSEFQQDFARVYASLRKNNRPVIACGGSGLYIESALGQLHRNPELPSSSVLIIGLNPTVFIRRIRIEKRLIQRIDEGLIDEVRQLLTAGIPPETLIRYGLEYKFVTEYLMNKISYDEMLDKLLVEIVQFSKRQITFFKKIERNGNKIQWLNSSI